MNILAAAKQIVWPDKKPAEKAALEMSAKARESITEVTTQTRRMNRQLRVILDRNDRSALTAYFIDAFNAEQLARARAKHDD